MGIEDPEKAIAESQQITEVDDEMDLEKEAEFDWLDYLANSPYASLFQSQFNNEEEESAEQLDDTSILFELKEESILVPEPPIID